MPRLLVTAFLAVSLLAAPALCLAGVVAHSCPDCSALSCGHEGDCAEDPCSETAVRPGLPTGGGLAPTPAVLPVGAPCGSALEWSGPAARPPLAALAAPPSLAATHHPLLI
jgi:hypothetical protein